MPQVQQHIPHSLTFTRSRANDGAVGGNIVVDTTTCCRGFRNKIQAVGSSLRGVPSFRRSMTFEGSEETCGVTGPGSQTWSSAAITVNLWTGSHSGGGTIDLGTGAFSGTGTGNAVATLGLTTTLGLVTGPYTLAISGTATSPTTGTFSGTISGAFTATFTGSFSPLLTTYTAVSPAGVTIVQSGSNSFTVNVGNSTFSFSGRLLASVAEWYLSTTVTSCAKGGATMEVRQVSDDFVVATYRNSHHGFFESQLRAEMYLVSNVCDEDSLAWTIFGGVNNAGTYNSTTMNWPHAVTLLMISPDLNPFGCTSTLPATLDLDLSSDGDGLGTAANGAALTGAACVFNQTIIPVATPQSGSIDFIDSPSFRATYFQPETIHADPTVAITSTVKVVFTPTDYGPLLATLTLSFVGRFRIDRVRLSDSVTVSTFVNAVQIVGEYRGLAANVPAGAFDPMAMTLARERLRYALTGPIADSAVTLEITSSRKLPLTIDTSTSETCP